MSQDLPTNPLNKSINRLTIAAWAIALMLLAHLLMYAVPFLFPSLYAKEVRQIQMSLNEALKSHQADAAAIPLSSGRTVKPQKPLNFHELSLDEQIKQASVIAVTRYENTEDGKVRQVISELLKRDLTAGFNYEVGDEYIDPYANQMTSYGDGMVMFFKGSPAHAAYSTSFTNDHIYGLEDIPLALLREKCKQLAAQTPAPQGAPNSAVQ